MEGYPAAGLQRSIGGISPPTSQPQSLVKRFEDMQEVVNHISGLLYRFESVNDRISATNRTATPADPAKPPAIPPSPAIHADLLFDRLLSVRAGLEQNISRLEIAIFG